MNAPSSFVCSPVSRMHRQRGVGLMEVMIAVLVLGIGVLGVMALQTVALKNTDSSALSSQATIQVYAMFDLLRAKNDKKEGGAGVPPAWTTHGQWEKGNGSRSATQLGTVEDWLTSLQETLGPDAEGLVDCDPGAYGVGATKNTKCTVGVRWNDSRGTKVTDKANERFISMDILL